MLKAGKSARRAALPQIVHPASLFRHLSPRAIRKASNRLKPILVFASGYHEGAEYGNHALPQVEAKGFNQAELRNRQQQPALLHLVNAYRRHGHLSSNLDPLGIRKAELIEELSAGLYGLTEESKAYNIEGIIAPSSGLSNQADLSTIIGALQKTYCRNVSYEFEHITSPAVRQWFAEFVESMDMNSMGFRRERFFEQMTKAEVFEQFLQKKLPNVKRYGLEGSESMAVLLDQLIFEGSRAGIADTVLGLSHRGRVTLMATMFGYSETEVFHKLRGGSEFPNGSPLTGDFIVDLTKPAVVMCPETNMAMNIDIVHNACHLESGAPVALGKSRTKDANIARARKSDRYTVGDHVLAVSVHGDSSFAGQGIVAETLGMSGLAHFTNGGTIHIVLNNQVGYTTPASHARSTRYASDVAKFADIPIIHVNGEHPEEVARAAQIAFAYRSTFRKDIVIDMWTFRTRGHNEMDEPSFTQPAMYRKIHARKSIPAQFEQQLINDGQLTSDYVDAFRKSYVNKLNNAFAQSLSCNPTEAPKSPRWRMLSPPRSLPVEKSTGVDTRILKEVGIQSATPSSDCKVHPRIERFHIKPRIKRLSEDQPVDWATAEAMAFGTLLKEGYYVRLSGQDVGRGTFSQRHAMLVCQETEQISVPLNLLPGKDTGKIEVVNSNLCEEAALAFEYGVSVEDPFTLTIWEAQFGDFFNNAQTQIDGYVTSGETKWGQQNGLVVLLPHGFDGGGPDHSSCRLERHLLLSNDPVDGNTSQMLPNVYIAFPTTPAQMFHLLRRQMKRNFRKPLIVAGPKTLLRLAQAVSPLSDMGPGTSFQPVLDDPVVQDPLAVRRVMMVSGKLYYDLAKLKSEHPLGKHVAIVRVEELSPFPRQQLYQTISQYSNASDFVWVQEEPRNAGAYSFMAPRITQLLPEHVEQLRYVGRDEHATVCSGVEIQQAEEHVRLTREAFEGLRSLVVDLAAENTAPQIHHQQVDSSAHAAVMPSIAHRWGTSSRIHAAQGAADQ